MLLRLLKLDIRSTGRIMVVLYAAVLVLAAVSRVLSSFLDKTVGSVLIMFFAKAISVLFVVAVVACIVMTFVLMLIRFYKNFLTDEGYLMFTLPVTTGQLIWSKLLVAVLWVIVSAAVGILASFILTVGTDAQSIIFDLDLHELFEGFTGGQTTVIVVLLVALVFLYAAYTYLRCYAFMAVGQSFGSRKLLLSVVFYIAFGIAESICLTLVARPLLNTSTLEKLFTTEIEPFHAVLTTLGGFCGVYFVLCALYFIVTYFFFHKKLNLQ